MTDEMNATTGYIAVGTRGNKTIYLQDAATLKWTTDRSRARVFASKDDAQKCGRTAKGYASSPQHIGVNDSPLFSHVEEA